MKLLCAGRAQGEGPDSKAGESVVVMVYRDGTQRVVLLTGHSVCGTAVGQWPAGFFDGEIPANHDVTYIVERFGLRVQDVNMRMLRVWNNLYLGALDDVRAMLQAEEVKSGNEG